MRKMEGKEIEDETSRWIMKIGVKRDENRKSLNLRGKKNPERGRKNRTRKNLRTCGKQKRRERYDETKRNIMKKSLKPREKKMKGSQNFSRKKIEDRRKKKRSRKDLRI